MKTQKECYSEACTRFIGGCGAGGRFHAAYGQPVYMARADGSKLYDVEGKEYIDFHTGAGPALFGYNNPRINAAVMKALEMGNFINWESEYHAQLAELICDLIPCAEKVRLHNSGSEATLAAIRLARGYTGRDIVIRFEGHFHGMHELIWYNHNSMGAMDDIGEIQPIPDSAGFPGCFDSVVKVVEYNDIEALTRVVERYKDQVACIIMEPISFNCGCYPGRKAFLEQVRELCTREKIVMIFDEVICGFRMRPGSAQGYYGITPDLTTLAKALGGGLSIAALCGKAQIMEAFTPMGKVGSSGTTSGALMPVLGAIECLQMVKEPIFYDHIDALGTKLYSGIDELFVKHGIPGHVRGVGARFGIYFGVEDPETDYNWRKVRACFDVEMSRNFIRHAIDKGLYFHDYGMSPVPQHNGFSSAHSLQDIEVSLERMDEIFQKIK